MDTNTNILNLGTPQGNIPPFHLQLDALKKVILRDFQGEKYFMFLYENGGGWSFHPQQAFGKQGLEVTIKHLIHSIKEAMLQMQKTIDYEEQRLVEKKIGNHTHASWKTVVANDDQQ